MKAVKQRLHNGGPMPETARFYDLAADIKSTDALPPPLRQAIKNARLPWSAQSVRRFWGQHYGKPLDEVVRLFDEEDAAMYRNTLKGINDE